MTAEQLYQQFRLAWNAVVASGCETDTDDDVFVQRVADEVASRTGSAYVGHGSERLVFEFGPHAVIKFAVYGDANALECWRWVNHRGAPEGRLLAPILECDPDGGWLVMERASPLVVRDVPAQLDDSTRAKLDALGADDWERSAQWGLLDGRAVLVDYGWGDDRHARATLRAFLADTWSPFLREQVAWRAEEIRARFSVELWMVVRALGDEYQLPIVGIESLVVPEADRNRGIGTAVMEDVIQWADGEPLVLSLSPSKDFGSRLIRLRKFYKRFGFVPNRGRHKQFGTADAMVRQPCKR